MWLTYKPCSFDFDFVIIAYECVVPLHPVIHMNVMAPQITDNSVVCSITNSGQQHKDMDVRITDPLWWKSTGDN